MKKSKVPTSKQKGNLHDITMPLLSSMYREFQELSKKKPEAAVSKAKIAIVNRLLEKMRIVLKDEATIEFLDILVEDYIPQVSDVTLILSQYVASMEAFKRHHYDFDKSAWTYEKNE